LHPLNIRASIPKMQNLIFFVPPGNGMVFIYAFFKLEGLVLSINEVMVVHESFLFNVFIPRPLLKYFSLF
jgi:hypothetical protein